MIKIAIVEDDAQYASKLLQHLDTYQKEEKEEFYIKVYRDGKDIAANYKAQYDIILMDIQMKFVDGMTAAEEIRKTDPNVVIMFITNISQYAIRGYEVGALDYILKPVSYFAFSQKLRRAISRLQKMNRKYIMISVKGGIKREDVSNIYYIESQGHNLVYHTKDGIFLSNGTLKNAENLLSDMHFSRGNNGYLINLEHVEAIKDKCAIVKGEPLFLSRLKINTFMQELTKYWGEIR
ncbi:hypothetical protein C806_03212 [Lachnospiraceae bacterium 3-1]|nr:hypothetical protein C806_03212 [Lachnospiraceae bacterium 3-1]